jgi:hypothetical protein
VRLDPSKDSAYATAFVQPAASFDTLQEVMILKI